MEGLQTAFILGRQRDIYFGMPAIQYVYEKISPESFERLSNGRYEVTDIKTIAHFIYAGVWGGSELNDEKPDYSYKDVYKVVEEMLIGATDKKALTAVGLAFSESTSLKYLKDKAKGSKKKQKLTGEKSVK